MVGCCVIGCKSRSERNNPNITFHRFPNEPCLRNKWTECTGRIDWHPSRHSRICSSHFETNCFLQKKCRTCLNPSSIPTLFIHNQNQAGKIKKEEKQITQSSSSPSESTNCGSFSYQIENKQEEMASAPKSRKRTSTETSTPSEGLKVECRVCLQYVCCEKQCCEIFGPWNQNPEATIASYFTQVTNIQVSPSDRYSKYICFKCLGLLQNCVLFIERAHNTQTKLQRRFEIPINDSSESLWPKPIQIDKCLSNNNKIEIEVKQEVLSDEDGPVTEMDELSMDIKVEPEEYSSYDCSPQIMDTVSITPIIEDESMDNTDLNRYYEDEHYLEEHIKEEPVSENETEVTPDLPLDCMLCTKTFNSVSGLKAHVIAQHSYLTIARKPEARPRIYQCLTCRRTFSTHTDLIVHESCHGKYACYMCNSKFDTFLALTKHRKRCRNNGNHVSRLKTLDDVKRPSPDPQYTKITDSTNKELELQNLNPPKEVDSTNSEPEPQQMLDAKAPVLTTTETLASHSSKTAETTNKELESQKLQHPKAGDSSSTELESRIIKTKRVYSTDEKRKMEKEIIEHIKAVVNSTGIESKEADPTTKESKKMQYAKLEDSVNEITLQKVEYLPNTEITNQKETIDLLIQDDLKVGAINDIDNSPQASHSFNANNSVTEDNNCNSVNIANFGVNDDNSEVNHANSEADNSNSVLDDFKSEINHTNCESSNPNQDLDTQIQMNDGCIQISTENKDFNQPVQETNAIEAISSDLSQKESLNGKKADYTNPKETGSTEMASHDVNAKLNSEHLSKISNLDSDNTESVLEMNKTTQSLTESANSIELSENSKENPSLVAESDSMKIHLAIHSLEKKSLDDLNEVTIEDKVIEATKSNEDKMVLQ